MTVSEIFTLLINSEDLSLTYHLPQSYNARAIARLKQDLSNYKNRNKDLYEETLGECTLSYLLEPQEDGSNNLTITITDSHPKSTEWEGLSLIKG